MTDYVFQPSSNLTFETVEVDSKRLLKMLRTHRDMTGIRFNLSKVTHCDSTGLALLIEAKRLCKRNKIAFAMDHISETLGGLAQFCGVDAVLT